MNENHAPKKSKKSANKTFYAHISQSLYVCVCVFFFKNAEVFSRMMNLAPKRRRTTKDASLRNEREKKILDTREIFATFGITKLKNSSTFVSFESKRERRQSDFLPFYDLQGVQMMHLSRWTMLQGIQIMQCYGCLTILLVILYRVSQY